MKPYYSIGDITLYHGDCLDVIPGLSDIDYILTDPPYGLTFMGKEWDRGSPAKLFWEAFRAACKPGAILMSFGGTRTWHRLACAIEDAGWDIRDCLMYLYGSGWPKSHDISKGIDKAAGAKREVVEHRTMIQGGGNSLQLRTGDAREVGADITAPATEAAKQWDGWGTALKPAWEPVILAMNPLDGKFAHNAVEHGVAGLNIDAGRIEFQPGGLENYRQGHLCGKTTQSRNPSSFNTNKPLTPPHPQGRWPANLMLDETAAAMLDAQSGECVSGSLLPGHKRGDSKTVPIGSVGIIRHAYGGDSGGASRFFYTSKANAEREPYNNHPTLKPVCLMQYLLRLLSTPTGGVVLDPFAGSGTTLLAAKRLQRAAIGIEKDEAYCEIAARRLEDDAPLFNEPPHQDEPPELFTMEDNDAE